MMQFNYRRMLGLAAGIVLAIAADAGAQTIPDMKGTWQGLGKSIVAGAPIHHPQSEPSKPAGPARLRELMFTFKIDGQEDTRFWGTVSSKIGSEMLIGTIASDDKRVYMVDNDGFIDGVILDKDTIEICYRERTPATAVVVCNVAKRQK